MIGLRVEGAREAFQLLAGVGRRMRDSTEAWDAVADDVFEFERRWWLTEYGARRDQDTRSGRDPQLMVLSGGLHASVTRRGAARQVVDPGPRFLLVAVTDGLAPIHERRGREVLGEPGAREVEQYAGRLVDYWLTGRA